MSDTALVVLAAVGLAVLLPLGWVLAIFNRLVRVRQQTRESWSDIDVELKRRYDLIPNLVDVVKGYTAHERSVLERVVELRNRAAANNGPAASQASDESALLVALKQVFAVAEGYPQLKADQQFLSLQRELANQYGGPDRGGAPVLQWQRAGAQRLVPGLPDQRGRRSIRLQAPDVL